MPTLPSQAQVKTDVLGYIAGFTGIKPSQIDASRELKKAPLSFNDDKLAFLAMSLRGYVKSYNAKETVLASETRKSGTTTDSLSTLIFKKVTP